MRKQTQTAFAHRKKNERHATLTSLSSPGRPRSRSRECVIYPVLMRTLPMREMITEEVYHSSSGGAILPRSFWPPSPGRRLARQQTQPLPSDSQVPGKCEESVGSGEVWERGRCGARESVGQTKVWKWIQPAVQTASSEWESNPPGKQGKRCQRQPNPFSHGITPRSSRYVVVPEKGVCGVVG